MALTLNIPPEIEEALQVEASQRGTTPELLALDSLRERFPAHPEPESSIKEAGSMADFLAGYIGALHSSEHVPGGAQMSESSGQRLAEILLEKRRRNRL